MTDSKRARQPRVVATLIPAGQRLKWGVVAFMGVLTAAAESIAALSVAALLAAMTDDTAVSLDLPIIGDITELLPGDSAGDRLRFLAIVAGAFFLIRGGLQLARMYVQSRVAHRTGARISSRLFRGYISMPYSFHISHNSSELMRNASWAADEVVGNYLQPIAAIIVQVSLLGMLMAVLVAAAPTVTLVTLAVLLPATIVIVQLVRPKLRHYGRTTNEQVQDSLNSLQQTLHGIRDVKVLGRERHFASSFRRTRDKLAQARYLSTTLSFVPSVSIETLVIIAIISFVAISSADGLSEATLPTLGLFAYAGLRMMPAVSSMVSSVNKLRYGQSVASTVAEDLRLIGSSRNSAPWTPAEPISFEGELTLNDVNFSYDGITPTLEDISLVVNRGESIGIVGETGAGKSTLLDIILGLLKPQNGSVLLDGHDLWENARNWHAIIGLVPQDIYLLDDSIRRNIAYGLEDQEIDDEMVLDALRLAQLGAFLESLPDGLDTNVGERGVRLSGGQRQRVAIARALYRKPEVLIFDEGTASLDNVTEAALMSSLENLRRDHTLITVAHRLTTVESADRIVLLDAGKIADEGTYEELRERNEIFRRMAKEAGRND